MQNDFIGRRLARRNFCFQCFKICRKKCAIKITRGQISHQLNANLIEIFSHLAAFLILALCSSELYKMVAMHRA